MRSLTRLFITIYTLLLSFTANAHGYWIETEGAHKAKKEVTVKLYYGDYPAGERLAGKWLDKMKDIKVFVTSPTGEKQELTMKQQDSAWVATYTPQSEGLYEITGINDTREVQDWTKHKLGITRPVQYLKAYYTVGKGSSKENASLFIDVVTNKVSKDRYEIIVSKDGAPVTAQKIVLASYGTGEKEITTDAAGKAVVALDKSGLYILSIDWIDNTPGTFKDKPYETVRHRYDRSLYR